MKPDVPLKQALSPLQSASSPRASLSPPQLWRSLLVMTVSDSGAGAAIKPLPSLTREALMLTSITLKVKRRARLRSAGSCSAGRLSQQQNKPEEQGGFAG